MNILTLIVKKNNNLLAVSITFWVNSKRERAREKMVGRRRRRRERQLKLEGERESRECEEALDTVKENQDSTRLS